MADTITMRILFALWNNILWERLMHLQDTSSYHGAQQFHGWNQLVMSVENTRSGDLLY